MHKKVLFFCETIVVIFGDSHTQEISQTRVHARIGFIWLFGVKVESIRLKKTTRSTSRQTERVALVKTVPYSRSTHPVVPTLAQAS